jgi:hypothetical protein
MKTNHRRNDLKRQDYNYGHWFRSWLLKDESNRARRRHDRAVIIDVLRGNENQVFALNHMGNPFHWD